MKKIVLFILAIALFSFNSFSQVAVGQWRTHFAYNISEQIEQSDNKIFVVSEGALFSVDKRDASMEFYSKLSGLNGTVISRIAYDETNRVLLIFYHDGNIDFMTTNGVKNLPDFYNKQLSGEKKANHILFFNNKAFIATDFGILVLNMVKMEIEDTYYIGDNASEVLVNNTAIYNDKIYAVTPQNIFSASASSNQLINFEYWEKLKSLPGTGEYQALVNFEDNLILLRGGRLYKQDNVGNWSAIGGSETNYTKLIASNNYLQAYNDSKVFLFHTDFSKTELTELSTIKDGVYDDRTNKFWFAGNPKGVAEYQIGNPTNVVFHMPNGPAINMPDAISFAGEKMFVLPGGRWIAPFGRPGNVMIYENNTWNNILNTTIEKSLTNIDVKDFTSIAVDPDDNSHFYVSSGSTGIYEFKNNEFFRHYNRDNSIIESALDIENYYYQWVNNVVLDKNKNLWFTNDLVANGIKVFKANGESAKLGFDGINNRESLGKILISNTNENQKWVLSIRQYSGICVFDDNGTIDDQADDASKFHSSFIYPTNDGINTIAPQFYYCMEQEANGAIWVGTSSGPLLFSNPSKAFDNDFTCSRIVLPRNDGTGLGDYLLEDQHIFSIAIDGANRKWFGTRESGVYLMSENGQETIYHFTTKNSPLTSNEIRSIAINPVTGEVFFGTGSGLVSFQSDAAMPNSVFKDVHAYPNPVRENFEGIITITGLVEDTNVKITDTAGNLISETTSNGSIATWDGKNKYGDRVSTGVYIVVCVSPEGEQSTSTKILVIN